MSTRLLPAFAETLFLKRGQESDAGRFDAVSRSICSHARKVALGTCVTLQLTVGLALTQEAPTPAKGAATPTTAPAAPLSKLDPAILQTAIQDDSITVPTPGELFEALSNTSTPNWSSQYRQPIPTAFSNRVQIALNLGGLIADGYIAIEGQDSQQVKNIGTDIIKLAKALGVSENVLSRGNSINEFAENNEVDRIEWLSPDAARARLTYERDRELAEHLA